MVEYSSEREQGALFLPPGFRFHPTDEEIISSYLLHKFLNPSFTSRAVGDVDLNKCEPWDLPSKAKMGEKEWYFFCQKDMKYPTGMRANRATKEGYWKATGKDKEIFDKGRVLVGMKKTLVFYRGRAPRGAKTNWVMHEFRLDGDGSNLRINRKDEWVVCKVFHKKGGVKKTIEAGIPVVSSVDGGGDDDLIDSMIDPAYFNPSNLPNTTNGGAASAVAGGAVASSFLPSYSFNSSNQVVMSNSMPTSTSAAPQSYYSYLHDHQAMVNALGGVIHPNFGVSKGFPESSPVGVPPRNSVCVPQQKLGGYGTPYAASCLISTSTSTSTTTIGVAPNLGAHQVHY